MADVDQDQKTEQPTEKRLSEALDRGQFAKSPELSMMFPLVALIAVLGLSLPGITREVTDYSIAMFSQFATTPVNSNTVVLQWSEFVTTVGRSLAPILIGCVGAAMLAGGLQSGFRLAPNAIGLKFENLNFVAGFGRVFSKGAAMRAVIDLLKLAAIGTALWFGARGLIVDPLFTAPVAVGYLGEFLQHATMLFLARLIFALGVVAAISYGYEKFKMSRQLMMTREEVKEERRSAEGNQHAKAAMRRMARRLMQKQMLAAVKTADVVVTNPTHYAVALKYERGRDRAPIVLAKGENLFARRIKALASEHGVPMVENKPVARMLFAVGQVGQTIPTELYQIVAEILAVVYRTHRYYFHRLKARRMEAAG